MGANEDGIRFKPPNRGLTPPARLAIENRQSPGENPRAGSIGKSLSRGETSRANLSLSSLGDSMIGRDTVRSHAGRMAMSRRRFLASLAVLALAGVGSPCGVLAAEQADLGN